MEPKPLCPTCHLELLPEFYFCPNCGRSVRPKPLATSISKQISIYLISFFLPPFGLVPAIKYLQQKDGKIIGIIAIVLTVLSIVIATYFTVAVIHSYSQLLTSQLNTTQIPGY